MMQTGRVRGKLVEWFQLHCFVSSHRQFPPTKRGGYQRRKTNNLQANFLLWWTFTLIQSSFVPVAKQTSAEPQKKENLRKHKISEALRQPPNVDARGKSMLPCKLRPICAAQPGPAPLHNATHVISTNLAVVLWESRGQQVRLFSPSVSKGVSAIKFTVWWTPALDSTRSDEKLLLDFNAWFVAHLKGHSYEANWAKIVNIRRTMAPSVGWELTMRHASPLKTVESEIRGRGCLNS